MNWIALASHQTTYGALETILFGIFPFMILVAAVLVLLLAIKESKKNRNAGIAAMVAAVIGVLFFVTMRSIAPGGVYVGNSYYVSELWVTTDSGVTQSEQWIRMVP